MLERFIHTLFKRVIDCLLFKNTHFKSALSNLVGVLYNIYIYIYIFNEGKKKNRVRLHKYDNNLVL